ncbi:hypothetical protein [Niameybacter massiliensis]|uniref:hypothetical protein n=1 Tax=Niameybacter massiliensis TaxID=1658108 RepID=UPI0006B43540|nr:hypothetical protein [Niameybacter massiliensis]
MSLTLTGYSKSHRLCESYFFVNGHKLEHFRIVNKGYISYSDLNDCVFNYRLRQYSFEELIANDAFELEIADCYTSIMSSEMFCMELKDRFIFRLLETLENSINKARLETINASSKFSMDFLNSDISCHMYGWYYRQRCYQAINAINTYNSIFDILMQLIWIYEYSSPHSSSFTSILKEYNRNKFIAKYEHKTDVYNLFFTKRYKRSKKFHDTNSEYATIRNWCNTIKHSGNLEFEGNRFMDKPTSKVILNNGDIHSSTDAEYTYLDLDLEVIPELLSYHKAIYDLSEKVIAYISK